MPNSKDVNQIKSLTRRDVVKSIGFAASTIGSGSLAGFAVGEDLVQSPPTSFPTAKLHGNHSIVGIDPKNVVDEYKVRNLNAVSDAELYRQSTEIVAKPARKVRTSFTLHAPLEVMARYGLLPFVEPQQRYLARLQLVASAAAYDHGVVPDEPPTTIQPFSSLSVAKKEFEQTFREGDKLGLESHVLQIATQFGTASLVHLLTPLALPTLTGASHSHIGLWLLLRHGLGADTNNASLLRAAARSLARDPKSQLTSFSGMSIAGTKQLDMQPSEIEQDILTKLTNPKKGEISYHPSRTGMAPLIMAGEETGNADTLFADFIRHDLTYGQMDAAFRAVLRVCAHSMLQDDIAEAKLGWTHCLTLPQAACGLSSLNFHRKLALASALVWITAYRSSGSTRALNFNWKPEQLGESVSFTEALHTSPKVAAARSWYADPAEYPDIRRILATQASIRNDQHLVKYTRACFDMGSFDPMHQELYLAAAAYLCAHWIQERPQEKILDNLLVRRDTP